MMKTRSGVVPELLLSMARQAPLMQKRFALHRVDTSEWQSHVSVNPFQLPFFLIASLIGDADRRGDSKGRGSQE